MENATQALFIAAGILVAVLIISVAVALFSMFGSSSERIITELEQSKITEFNNNFLKYYGEGVEITAHDIVTMANFAKKNNEEVDSEGGIDYIQIYVKNGKNINDIVEHFENKDESFYSTFLKENMLNIKKVKDGDTEKIETEKKLYKMTEIKFRDVSR